MSYCSVDTFICFGNFCFSPRHQVPIHAIMTVFLMGLIKMCFFSYLTHTQPLHKAFIVNRTNTIFFFSV